MSNPRVVVDLAAGSIVFEVFERRAPRAAAYFLDLVDSGLYDGSTIYRATRLAVSGGPLLIQGGPLGAMLAPDGREVPSRPILPRLASFETTRESGLLHESGTVSLARDLLATGDAISEFFVCLGEFPQLDFGGRTEPDRRGFPAIGRVLEGLDVVEKIAGGPTEGSTPIPRLRGEILSNQVSIERMASSTRVWPNVRDGA